MPLASVSQKIDKVSHGLVLPHLGVTCDTGATNTIYAIYPTTTQLQEGQALAALWVGHGEHFHAFRGTKSSEDILVIFPQVLETWTFL